MVMILFERYYLSAIGEILLFIILLERYIWRGYYLRGNFFNRALINNGALLQLKWDILMREIGKHLFLTVFEFTKLEVASISSTEPDKLG